MKELLERIQTEFDEAEGNIRIVDADWYADDLRISLSVLMHNEAASELWEAQCIGVVEESICSVEEELLSISKNSPLLIPYQEVEIDLFFSGNSCSPESLLGVLFSACVEIMGKAEYLVRFLNQKPTVNGIVKAKFGTLGRFPKPLAGKITQELSALPINIKPIEVGAPKHWTGSEFISYPSLSVFELGNSYVIAERFGAVRA
ncbi:MULTISPECIES: hypothetical protein [Vibrio]|uniref:hypothetical protein n=1 Tax=Vibrio TaxID=662 RepID=UPI002075E37C|nr:MULTISPECIES: hypothetical protein [Vibrio]USD33724.1 hypothetical protein J8Z27_06380 [Vibrio sp. SCSIO 43186]USD46795.1 hypothetical protein J4N38_06580 [Vibrio sp. SCSIO 43145]USD70848.1 hypothetical protein J4N41_06380 [Vibrio sp. SCSIO 43139]USD95760.1 hypothetical protein CTT30_06480 [Vibrio coralliilyticus]